MTDVVAPPELAMLIERFSEHIDAYRGLDYKEAQVRQEFIDPFFKLLGWDMDNNNSYAEQYKDVVHEDAIKIGGATKAPDYSFRIGGVRKFFVEAKKPSMNIKDDTAAAYQVRRYAWSAKLPVSILTNFEEFAVYDCRKKPESTDSAATGRIMYFKFQDYVKEWPLLLGTFSREAILKGSFDKFVSSSKNKRGTSEVDEAFLSEIEGWRDQLARNFALRNPDISQRELNYAVQRTIDRIIFLRICEDRGIEPYGQLQALLNGEGVYQRLCTIFDRADERYNSGLFHFHTEKGRSEAPDGLSFSLLLDDKVLKTLFKRLYYPDSPYEFSVLPADILGQVYEQFLGKVIRLTAGHQAKVEEKPEVKKAGGVYYTPTYIVDYIVKNTVGTLLAGKTPREAATLRVLDPSCGSGSFLIGAYQFLLDWHLQWYLADGAEKHGCGKSATLHPAEGGWRLTTAERKRILVNNIYGVDIDGQAVEVTKLSLLLKVLEGETTASLTNQMAMFRQRALPDLGANIKCGNSLIGPDFYQHSQLLLLDEEEHYRINVFDWHSDKLGFGKIMKAGGFDVVIGNPPYVRIQAMKEWVPVEVDFYKKKYLSASKGNYDIYVVFVEKGLSLLNPQGLLGFVLPHKFFNSQYGEALRGIIADGNHLKEVVHFGSQQVFPTASTYTCLLLLQQSDRSVFRFRQVDDLELWKTDMTSFPDIKITQPVGSCEWNFTSLLDRTILDKIEQLPYRLHDVTLRVFQGPITSADKIFLFKKWKTSLDNSQMEVFSQALGCWITIESSILKKVTRSGDVLPYYAKNSSYVLFPYAVQNDQKAYLLSESNLATDYPLAWNYLCCNRRELEKREKKSFRDNSWYRFGRTQNLGMWEQPKLLVPYMVKRLCAYIDTKDDFYFINVTTGGYGILCNTKYASLQYLCGLLNSRLLGFALRHYSTDFRGGYIAAGKQFLDKLPIRTIDFANPAEVALHERMVGLVETMLALQQQLSAATLEQGREQLRRRIEATDAQIDALVYQLYGLTEAEIAVVEGL